MVRWKRERWRETGNDDMKEIIRVRMRVREGDELERGERYGKMRVRKTKKYDEREIV